MKKTIIIAALAAFTLSVTLPSCSKYQDGPKFSLLTKKARLEGPWEIESVTVDGTDVTSFYKALLGQNFELEIEKDGTYSSTGTFPDKGTWTLGEDKDDIRFLSSDPGSTEDSYRILRLTSTEMWLKQTATNGAVTIVKYKQ